MDGQLGPAGTCPATRQLRCAPAPPGSCAAAGLRMEAATAARQARPIDLHIIIGPPPAQRKSLLSFAASAL